MDIDFSTYSIRDFCRMACLEVCFSCLSGNLHCRPLDPVTPAQPGADGTPPDAGFTKAKNGHRGVGNYMDVKRRALDNIAAATMKPCHSAPSAIVKLWTA